MNFDFDDHIDFLIPSQLLTFIAFWTSTKYTKYFQFYSIYMYNYIKILPITIFIGKNIHKKQRI